VVGCPSSGACAYRHEQRADRCLESEMIDEGNAFCTMDMGAFLFRSSVCRLADCMNDAMDERRTRGVAEAGAGSGGHCPHSRRAPRASGRAPCWRPLLPKLQLEPASQDAGSMLAAMAVYSLLWQHTRCYGSMLAAPCASGRAPWASHRGVLHRCTLTRASEQHALSCTQ
jgi:hypothetical protein